MRLRIAIAMLEIRNRKTLQSKVNICKSDVKIGDYADSLGVDCQVLQSLQKKALNFMTNSSYIVILLTLHFCLLSMVYFMCVKLKLLKFY